MTSGRRPTLLKCALFISCLLLVLGAADAALAQPFGMTRGSMPSPFGGFGPFSDFTGWMFAKQAEFYRMLSGAIRAAKERISLFSVRDGISAVISTACP